MFSSKEKLVLCPRNSGIPRNSLPLPVGQGVEDLFGDPLPKDENPFLVTGGAEVAALAGKGQKNLAMAAFALDPGKALWALISFICVTGSFRYQL